MLDFAIFAVTFVVILVGAVLYLYPSSRRASGIPGLNPTDEKDGNLQDIVNQGSLHEFLLSLHQEFGPVASFWFGGRPVVSLGSVEQLRQHINPNRTTDSFETMLKSLLGYQAGAGGGATEAMMRKKVYENGIDNTLKNNFHLVLQLVEELVEKWQSFPQGQHTPLCAHLLGLSMKTVTQLALGPRFKDDAEVMRFRKNHDAIWSEIGKGYLDGSMEKSSSRKGHYESALSEMESVLLSVTRERKALQSQSVFVDALLQSSLTERQIMEDSMVFTLAGCVITANLCVWAVHFMSTSEEVQDKLYEELEEVLGSGPVSLDKIPQLRYCQQVLNETVRTAKLTPVAARLQEVEGKVDQHVIPKESVFSQQSVMTGGGKTNHQSDNLMELQSLYNTRDVALRVHTGFRDLGVFCHGFLAGYAVWNTIIVYVLAGPELTALDNLLEHYHSLAYPSQSLLYMLLAISTVAAFDRMNLAKGPTAMREFVTLDPVALAAFFYSSALVLSLSQQMTSDRINLYESPNVTLWPQGSEHHFLHPWLTVNLVVALLVGLAWILIATRPDIDHTERYLMEMEIKPPELEDKNEMTA